ncbi:MAG TPA: AgmX/PglI C-terminal domain-containing protein [Kofleriaceae bacterium]
MGSRGFIILIALVCGGCEKKKPRLEGPVDVELGDCAGQTIAFVSGPRPLAFEPGDPEKLAEKEKERAKEKENEKVAAEDPPPPEDPPDPKSDDERADAIEQARTAGVLGRTALVEGGAFASLTGTGDISSGFDDTNIYGGLLGNEAGEMQGGFGFGRSGFGPGGGGTGWGTIGTGRYGKIGHGSGTGSGYGVGGGRGGMRGRSGASPTVRIGQPNANGDLDKAIIRRYIKRNLQKIQYCYEKALLAKPNLAGTVSTTFFITPNGQVAQSQATGVDKDVASCVARVIKQIEFPKPKGGGGVQVNYPFTFVPAGGAAAKPAAPTPSQPPPPPEPDEPEDDAETGGSGAAMALDEGKMGKKDSDRSAGAYNMAKNDPKKAGGPYRAGAESPLRPIVNELEECFRLQTKRHGIAVIDIAPDKLVAHGIENAEFKKCVAGLAKKVTNKAVQRCSIAFGPMPIAEAPSVEITPMDVKFLGNKVASTPEVVADEKTFKNAALFEAAEKRNQAMRAGKTPVVLHGPLLVKPLGPTPMRAVNVVYRTLLMAGEDPVLAAQQGGDWKPLRTLAALPVVPVPIGTGGSWNTQGGRARDVQFVGEDERIHMSILVTEKEIWVGLSRINEYQQIVGHDLTKLAETLAGHKKSLFQDRTDIEVAGEDTVPYAKVVEVIEAATKAGFIDWSFHDPMGLSARPQL